MVESGNTPHDSNNDDFDRNLDAMLEQELRIGFQAIPAPDGFADRVLARIDAVPNRKSEPWPVRTIRNPLVRGAIAAMLLLSVGVGGYMEHQRERQIAGEHARQQVLLALRITSSTLQDVRNKVDGMNANQQDEN